MYRNKFLLTALIGGWLFVGAMVFTGCEDETPEPEDLFEQNAVTVCDNLKQTQQTQDDCDQPTVGHFYNPGSNMIYYRSGSGETHIVQRDVRPSTPLKPGSTLGLTQPIVTNSSGAPLIHNGVVVRSPNAPTPGTKITTTPTRSTANFSVPGLGTATAGKITPATGASISRSGFAPSTKGGGMSFGGRGGGFGG